MAIKSTAELKDTIALGKNDSQLFINMVDSFGYPQDSNGNSVLTQHTKIGDVFDASKWGSGAWSLDLNAMGSVYNIASTGETGHGTNFYLDGGLAPKFKGTGFAVRTIYSIDGSKTEQKSNATGVADGAITWIQNKETSDDIENLSLETGTTVTEALNQIYTDVAINIAAIANLDSNDIGNDSGVTGANVTGALNTLNTNITFLDSSDIENDSIVLGADVTEALNQLLVDIGNLGSDEISNESNAAGPNVTDALDNLYLNADIWRRDGTDRVLYSGATELERVQLDGNRSYNAAAIPGSLDSSISYKFWAESCEMKHKTDGSVWSCNNTYLETGSVWKSQVNSGTNCTFNRMDTTSFIIRQSTAVSTAIGQTMTMTTPITPT